MTDHPILFSGPMIRALLEGRKTQTRRILKPAPGPHIECIDPSEKYPGEFVPWEFGEPQESITLKWEVGDRLWVRETWSSEHRFHCKPSLIDPTSAVWYWADGNPEDGDWSKPRVSIFMPRWASRITDIVSDVRVQRLHEISEEDALAEGVVWSGEKQSYWVPGIEHPNKVLPWLSRPTPRELYAALWDVINGSGAWLANPWIVATTFTVERRNIDA